MANAELGTIVLSKQHGGHAWTYSAHIRSDAVFSHTQYEVIRYIHSTYAEIVYTQNRCLNNVSCFIPNCNWTTIYKQQLDPCKQQLD